MGDQSSKVLIKFPSLVQIWQRTGIIACLAIAYWKLAELSRYLASTPQDVTPVWPPDGLAVAAMLVFGYWVWPGILLGSFLANIWAFMNPINWFSAISSSLEVVGIAAGTTLGTILGTFLLRKTVQHRHPFERVKDVVRFLILTGMVGPIVNATVGVAMLGLGQKIPWAIYGSVWLTWWISNVAGIFILTPFLFNIGQLIQKDKKAQKSLFSKLSRTKLIEGLILLTLISGVGRITYINAKPLEYILIPLLIWAVFRFGQIGVTALTFWVAAIAVVGTVRGQGIFAQDDINESLILLQSFIGVIVFTTLILQALISEQKRAELSLKFALSALAKNNEKLECRVKERTKKLHEQNLQLEQTLKQLKQTQGHLIQSEKMSSLGQMVAGIAHEINNPVNFIHGNIIHTKEYIQDILGLLEIYQQEYPHPTQSIQEEIDNIDLQFIQEDITQVLASMETGSDRIQNIVISLRTFSRLDEAEFKQVDIHDGIESTLMLLRYQLKSKLHQNTIQVLKQYEKIPLVECYSSQLNQVVMNLLNNAIDGIKERYENQNLIEINPNPGLIIIETKSIENNQIEIKIIDNGIGMSEETKDKIFDPFFTTKPVGKGTGLGLSVSYQIIVERHNGKLECVSTLGQGTKFTITIPIHHI